MKKTASWAPRARSSALLGALLLGCASAPPAAPVAPPTRYAHAPAVDLRLACLDGELALSSLRGRAVLLVAFTSENLASQLLLRHVDQVAAAHPDDLVAIALAGDRMEFRDLALVLGTYRDVAGLTHSRLCGADESIRLGESDLGRIDHVPTLFLLNRAGGVARRLEDVPTREAIEAMVAPALPPR
ncbi:MAG: hypothetical protein R3A48_17575 [Polyangiales bacterium]